MAIVFKHRYKSDSLIGTGAIKFRPYTVAEPLLQLATPQNVTADGTTVSWDEVENATSYEIYADGVSIGTVEATPTPTLISFTIAGTSYQAEEGMTWEQWVNSSYNTGGFYVHNNRISTTGTNFISTKNIQSTEYAEYSTNVIAKETVYYLPSLNITPPSGGGGGN